jgi:hypothetical protein
MGYAQAELAVALASASWQSTQKLSKNGSILLGIDTFGFALVWEQKDKDVIRKQIFLCV